MKKLFSLCAVLVLLFTLSALSVSADNEVSSPFTYEVAEGAVTITACDTAAEGELMIPDAIDGVPVTAIGDKAFYGCKKLTVVHVPATITAIGTNAFGECSALTAIEVAEENTAYCDEEGIVFNMD